MVVAQHIIMTFCKRRLPAHASCARLCVPIPLCTMRQAVALTVFTLLAVLHFAACHPTRYPRHPKPDCKAAAPILSYHVHVVFGFNQFDAAMAVRNRTIERFKYERVLQNLTIKRSQRNHPTDPCSGLIVTAATTTVGFA